MKKVLVFLIVIISSVALLAGCGGGVPDLEDRTAETSGLEGLEFTGMIEPLELDIYQEGTHQIRTDDGQLIIIQSRDFDLNKYLEKRVKLKGDMSDAVGDSEPVLNVTQIELEDGSKTGEMQDYENRAYGFMFSYPDTWELTEGDGGVYLSADDYKWVTVKVYSDQSDVSAFASSKEEGDGTPVTVGAQKALRYTDGDSVRVYIPNPPNKKVYQIVFNGESRDPEDQKDYFYDLLESFKPIYSKVAKGDKCGGKEDLKCPESYRCELDSADAEAEGICVSVEAGEGGFECPFIPAPTGCNDYRVAEYSKTTGCPTRYECVTDEVTDTEESIALDVSKLTGTIEEYKDQMLGVKDAEIIQFELTESKNLIAVVYKYDEKKYKTLYSFAPAANEFNFIEKGHFEDNDGVWSMLSGDDLQSGLGKTIIKPGESASDDDLREVGEDMSLYENTHKGFSLEYPKDWYYRSFGAINNTRWIVGFGEKEIDYLSDAIINVSILDDEPKTESDMYRKVRNLDDVVYVVEGPESYKDTIDKMAASIQ